MAKKEPDRLGELMDELLKDQTSEEILGDSGALNELKKRLIERALKGDGLTTLATRRFLSTAGTTVTRTDKILLKGAIAASRADFEVDGPACAH